MLTGGTSFARTLCLLRDAWGSRPQQSCGTQYSPLGRGAQNQWRHSQSQRLSDPHGPRQSLWHLDGTAPQSFPAMPGLADLQISVRSNLNTFPAASHLHFCTMAARVTRSRKVVAESAFRCELQ